MYIETDLYRASKPLILLCESERESGSTKQHTLANQTDWSDNLVANFKLLLKREMTPRCIERNTLPSQLQKCVIELPGQRFVKSIR